MRGGAILLGAALGLFSIQVARADTEYEERANEVWPEYVRQWSPIVALEATKALENSDAWKAKAFKLSLVRTNRSGGTYEASYAFIVEVDGVPVCGDLDPQLVGDMKRLDRKTPGGEWGAHQECVAVVEGTCKVWERVQDPRDSHKFVRGRQIDGVRMRVVALKTKNAALSAGHGSSLEEPSKPAVPSGGDATPGATGGGPGPATSGAGGGTLHLLHRLLAWAMSLVLGVSGALTFLHGIARFVPQLQAQSAKLGGLLGWVGVALGLLGAVWFGLAALLPLFVGDVRFGSLPAATLVVAGAALGLDLARAKGKLDEKWANALQPLGIPVGLGCFLAAVLHVLFWDQLLL